MIAAPWAKDANGVDIPTHYVINGNMVTQVVDFDKNTAFPVVADPNWVKLGKHWYNQRNNVAKAIDIGLIIAGIGAGAKSANQVIKLIRANRTNITRTVERKIKKTLGVGVAGWVSAAINIGLTVGGTSVGEVIAIGLDKVDGKYDGYVFA